jgi:hypothetical protein
MIINPNGASGSGSSAGVVLEKQDMQYCRFQGISFSVLSAGQEISRQM